MRVAAEKHERIESYRNKGGWGNHRKEPVQELKLLCEWRWVSLEKKILSALSGRKKPEVGQFLLKEGIHLLPFFEDKFLL